MAARPAAMSSTRPPPLAPLSRHARAPSPILRLRALAVRGAADVINCASPARAGDPPSLVLFAPSRQSAEECVSLSKAARARAAAHARHCDGACFYRAPPPPLPPPAPSSAAQQRTVRAARQGMCSRRRRRLRNPEKATRILKGNSAIQSNTLKRKKLLLLSSVPLSAIKASSSSSSSSSSSLPPRPPQRARPFSA